MYQVKHMRKWQRESDYGGADMSDWYILVARNRDSNILENSNYECILKDLQAGGFKAAESDESTSGYLAASFGHWACGWIEAIMIHKDSDDKLLEWADNVEAGLDDYPLYNEEDYSEREMNLTWDYVREYVVADHINDLDLELSDKQIDSITSKILQEFEFEVNGYDEVLHYGCPDSKVFERIEQLAQDIGDTKHCDICGADYNSVKSACDCQIKMEI